ncbi:hypothetical protein FQN53_007078 [Emmonsiellopsis sp. PD_33]|nr:hypothetical protein FQN53_007078 [Emmonsiellopsis sp. PD_33]
MAESTRVSSSLSERGRGWVSRLAKGRISEERILVLKLDLFLLSWAFVAGLTKDMDQSATTQAYVSGMKEALSLYGNELVEFTTYFSIGYALAIIPSQLTQTMIRPSIFLPVCEVIWGCLTLAIYAAPNAKTIYALRFLLGIFESTSWPGIVSLIFNWYTPSELGKRIAIFGVSDRAGNMFLGILQAALYKNLDGVNGLEGWQWLFIVSGCITIFWGFLGLLIIPDSPAITRALWLTRAERRLAESRMQQQDTKTSKLISRQTLIVKLRAIDLKNSEGGQLYSTYTVNLIPLGGYGLAIVSAIGLNALSDWKEWRWQVSIGSAIVQIICCSVLAAWPNSRPTIMTFYFLTFTTAAWGYALLAWLASILRREPEGRSIIVAAAVTFTYVGHATIPLRVWRVSDSPRYPIGFPLSAAFGGGSILAILAIRAYIKKNEDIFTHGFKGQGRIEDAEGDLDDETGKPVKSSRDEV